MKNEIAIHVCADLESCKGHRQMKTLARMTSKVARALEAQGLGTLRPPFAPKAKRLRELEAEILFSGPNIVLDGCPYRCRAAMLRGEHVEFLHYVMTDLGAKKGYTPVSPDLVEVATGQIVAEITVNEPST